MEEERLAGVSGICDLVEGARTRPKWVSFVEVKLEIFVSRT
jgi:hypothetical protein